MRAWNQTYALFVAALALLICTLDFAAQARTSSPRAALQAQADTWPRIPTPADLVGVWETRNVEEGRDVGIAWIVKPDRTVDYEFNVDGTVFPGSTGTWEIDAAGILTEHWHRGNGVIESGRAQLALRDAHTLKLTILDNGNAAYTGKVRIYRRRGASQLSLFLK
ncbi:MAG: hypothetical protein R3D68_15645 [Hyphomicrobiaceae bacterium]